MSKVLNVLQDNLGVVWCSTDLDIEEKRKKIRGQIPGSLVELDLGYILWQIHCWTKLMIRDFLAIHRCRWNISIWDSVIIIWHVLLYCLFRVGATTSCPKRANMVAEKETRACQLSDNEWQHSPIPWQHKEFYSTEPMTNQDLDVRCFPSSNGRGREIKDWAHSDQEWFSSFI